GYGGDVVTYLDYPV
nr:214K exoantigen (version 2) - malaria parasite (Plasmodium falciparum) (fragments) [Plasmodium falciparum]